MAIVQIKKTAEGQPQQAIMAAFGTETYCKIVVVVDEDVDIFNLADVMWAVATRTRADRDLVFVHRAMGAILDPTSDPVDNTVTKIGVDATKPGGADFAERLTIADEQRTGSVISYRPPASGSDKAQIQRQSFLSSGFRHRLPSVGTFRQVPTTPGRPLNHAPSAGPIIATVPSGGSDVVLCFRRKSLAPTHGAL